MHGREQFLALAAMAIAGCAIAIEYGQTKGSKAHLHMGMCEDTDLKM